MDIQAILMFLYCLVCQYVELAAIHACPINQYEHFGTCCNKCGPGTFVLTHCNKTTQTVCVACKDGTFSKRWHSREECSLCLTRCQPTMGLVQTCNSTVDSQCGCVKPDQFHHIATDSCRDCLRCPRGKYPVKPCSVETICAACPENYFSNKTDNFNVLQCVKCTECEVYDALCRLTHDAVCAKEVFTTPQQQTSADGTSTGTTETWNSKESNLGKKKIDPAIIAVIVCDVTVVIIIAFVIYWKNKKDRYATRRRGGFNFIQECKGRAFSFGGLLLRDQPARIILGLHTLLTPEKPNNWRTVAAEIGVPELQIQNFETNLETAAKEMLHFWGTSREATVDRLYEALTKIGRDDACIYLEKNVELEGEETIV